MFGSRKDMNKAITWTLNETRDMSKAHMETFLVNLGARRRLASEARRFVGNLHPFLAIEDVKIFTILESGRRVSAIILNAFFLLSRYQFI